MSIYCSRCPDADECASHPEGFCFCQDNAARFDPQVARKGYRFLFGKEPDGLEVHQILTLIWLVHQDKTIPF